jgi:hypothetical protein
MFVATKDSVLEVPVSEAFAGEIIKGKDVWKVF